MYQARRLVGQVTRFFFIKKKNWNGKKNKTKKKRDKNEASYYTCGWISVNTIWLLCSTCYPFPLGVVSFGKTFFICIFSPYSLVFFSSLRADIYLKNHECKTESWTRITIMIFPLGRQSAIAVREGGCLYLNVYMQSIYTCMMEKELRKQ